MPRRKRAVYFRKPKSSSRPASSCSSQRLLSPRKAFPRLRILPSHLGSIVACRGLFQDNATDRRRAAGKMRLSIRLLSALSSLLAITAGVAAFLLMYRSEEEAVVSGTNALRTVVALSSVLQVPLIVMYWRQTLSYWELGRQALRFSEHTVRPLSVSRPAQWKCALECALNLVVMPPGDQTCVAVYFTSASDSLCTEQLLFLLILARSYHLARWFFWASSFSHLRAQVYARLTAVHPGGGYLFRCCLARYTYELIFGLFTALLIVSGAVQFAIIRSQSSAYSIFDSFWLVAYTQSTIGYGDLQLSTLLGKVTMTVSCFAGICILGLLNTVSSSRLMLGRAQADLCTELLIVKFRRGQHSPAIEVLQSWWRLMRMRQMRIRHAPVILNFYSHLGKFRKLLVARNKVHQDKFEYQVQAFDNSVCSRLQGLNEYISPVHLADTLVRCTQTQDIVRLQYRFCVAAERLKQCRWLVRYLNSRKESHADSEIGSTSAGSSSGMVSPKRLAKKKLEAFSHVKGRLLQ